MKFQGFLLTQWITAGCLIPTYAVVLYKARHSGNDKFVKNIAWLLLASNVAVLTYSTAWKVFINDP